MNEKALRILEFNKITGMLAELATSGPGRRLCTDLKPSSDPEEIRTALTETSDAVNRIRLHGQIGFGDTRDISASLKRLDIAASLSVSELHAISALLNNVSRVREWGSRKDGEETEPDSLDGSFSALDPVPAVGRELARCILSEDSVADEASPALAKIRRQLKTNADRMHGELNGILNEHRAWLMDPVIAMRDGSYCLPVKAKYKAKVPGVVHDQSATGSTVFIEPMAVIRMNNERRELELSEQREIAEILAGLSRLVAPEAEALRSDTEIMAHLDFVFAKARLSGEMSGSEPLINTDGVIELKDARHPLIARDRVVPITVMLGDPYDLLIITGPNTGGKTVSLKTVGLLTLMGQSGLHIPAFDGSRLAVFDDVFADIGDEQSIEQSLSTFSGHMNNIVEILAKADARSLCLFDELGAGTDPTEGAALAISILSFLHDMKTRTVATTHYSELKVYALTTPGVENACCEFDVETLKPTYRILMGIPGKSNAFAISKKLGLPDYIIENAKTHIQKNDIAFEDLLTQLEDDKRTMEKERREIDSYRQEIEALKNRYEKQDEHLEERKEKILRTAREEAQRIKRGEGNRGLFHPDNQQAFVGLGSLPCAGKGTDRAPGKAEVGGNTCGHPRGQACRFRRAQAAEAEARGQCEGPQHESYGHRFLAAERAGQLFRQHGHPADAGQYQRCGASGRRQRGGPFCPSVRIFLLRCRRILRQGGADFAGDQPDRHERGRRLRGARKISG